MAKSRQPNTSRRKRPAPAKDLLLQIRVSAQEKEAFTEAAALDGEGLSTWARRLMRRATTDRMREGGHPDPFAG
jgi:hypothetical protein